jgi:hypothetical protein
MLYVPSTSCTDNINAIAEFVPNASKSVFCHRLYCSRDFVCELMFVWALVVESSGNHMKLYATAVHVVQVSFILGSWLQKYKVLKLGHSLLNTLYNCYK